MRQLTKLSILTSLLILLAAGCGPTAPVAPAATLSPTQAATATPLATETSSPAPTDLPSPTATPEPSATQTEAATVAATSATPTGESVAETPAPTGEPGGGDEEPAGESFVPANTQVWQLDDLPYNTTSSSACGSDYPFNFYGLVGITSNGNLLTWKRQDATANLSMVSINNYFGQIPNFVSGYDLQIAVSFTSPTTLIVSYKLVSSSNPDCTHTYDYRAAFAWDA